jgi:hypothetical protein
MTERESAIEKYLVNAIEVLGGRCYKFGVVGRRGYPDRLCKLPGGSAFMVETKRPKKGRLAELQKVRHEELRGIGWRVYVAKDREEIDDVIRQETARQSQRAE